VKISRWSAEPGEFAQKTKDFYQSHRTVCALTKSPSKDFLFYVDDARGQVLIQNQEGCEGLQQRDMPEAKGVYRLSVLVNAVKTSYKKRIPLCGYQQIVDWLKEREESFGFKFISDIEVGSTVKYTAHKQGHKTITIGATPVSGLIEVTDQELFTKTLHKGIGKAKSFGFGMLRIIPVKQGL
jgi:hypothetical protein